MRRFFFFIKKKVQSGRSSSARETCQAALFMRCVGCFAKKTPWMELNPASLFPALEFGEINPIGPFAIFFNIYMIKVADVT